MPDRDLSKGDVLAIIAIFVGAVLLVDYITGKIACIADRLIDGIVEDARKRGSEHQRISHHKHEEHKEHATEAREDAKEGSSHEAPKVEHKAKK